MALALLAAPGLVAAQALCSSDGAQAPRHLLERFLSADCAECWTAPSTPVAGTSAVALDWVLPGASGDDAPLSAVARRDGLLRAQHLGLAPAPTAQRRSTRAVQSRQILRIAHGLTLNGYVGVSLRVAAPAPAGPGAWRAHLALVEHLPAGTENTPVARNLVRNSLERAWDHHSLLSKKEFSTESRVMAVPEGMRVERMVLVGWLEDPRGRLVAVAVADCRPPAEPEGPAAAPRR